MCVLCKCNLDVNVLVSCCIVYRIYRSVDIGFMWNWNGH